MGYNPQPQTDEAATSPSMPFLPRRGEPLGAPLEGVRARLLALAGQMRQHLDEHAAPLLDEAQRQLETRPCRIAVIGQVKAGKSTFINALAQRPGLLPTSINPWTAVVTSLHFRKSETAPEHAALFHFFSADEWRALAEGGGRLRELTERLVPEFQPGLLRAQLEVMRKRAERRLGSSFEELLGRCHRYKDFTSDLLSDYISAGDEYTEARANGRRRHYSDITRAAELFISDGPFAFPVTLIDTPGTNDPFLVRDEITRRSLENPDIYVFVLSALQPLSAADISMLRLLNGLHKDRILVFINRIDQLANPTADAAVVKSMVERRLRLEFPALDIPIVLGSAWLGSLCFETQGADLLALLKPSQIALLHQAGLPATIDPASRKLSSIERSRVALAMHMTSGMREVSAAITKLMATSASAIIFRQIAACMLELVRSADITVRAELRSIEELLDTQRRQAGELRAKIAEEQQSLAVFEERAATLRASFEQVEAHLTQLVASGIQALRNDLCHIVHEFADGQAKALLQAITGRNSNKAWNCNVMPLRQQLEETYVASFERIAGDLMRVEQFLYPQLKVIVAHLLPEHSGSLIEAPTAPLQSYPSVAPLADTVSMDLGVSWWKLWFAARPDARERAEHLKSLIEDDFLPLADELLSEAEAELSTRVGYTMQRANAISHGLLAGIERRRTHLQSESVLLNGSGGDESLIRFEAEQNERAARCIEYQAVYGRACGELERILRSLDAGQEEMGSA